jgi:dihydrofolate reductase
MIGMIYAVNPDGVIGKGGTLPWRYKGDMKRFKRITTGSTIIMGRHTWTSIGRRPLQDRCNLVVSDSMRKNAPDEARSTSPFCASLSSVPDALELSRLMWPGQDIWFIGGAHIYAEAESYVDIIDATYVPDMFAPADDLVYLPKLATYLFDTGPLLQHEDEPTLGRHIFTRRRPSYL